MSVTKRATRNRVDPLPVRANHFFEKPESDVKRFDRGRVGVSYIALGVAIAGGMAYANSFPLSELRNRDLAGVSATAVAASLLVALCGLRIARKRDQAALSRLVHVIVPARVLAWLLSHPREQPQPQARPTTTTKLCRAFSPLSCLSSFWRSPGSRLRRLRPTALIFHEKPNWCGSSNTRATDADRY